MPSNITATASSAVTSSNSSEQKSPRGQLQRLAALVVVLSLGVVAGCASAGHTSRAPSEVAGLVVAVRNDSFTDVRVYALVGEGSRIRLGSVAALSQRALTLPSTVLSSNGVRLIAEPLASGGPHSTDVIRASQGDTIQWHLANRFEVSRWFVRM